MADEARILWFDAVGSADVKRVGGKNASLGEMIGALKSEGVRVPDGFATTAAAYRDYVNANGIEPKLRAEIMLPTGSENRFIRIHTGDKKALRVSYRATVDCNYDLLTKDSLHATPIAQVDSDAILPLRCEKEHVQDAESPL